MKNNDLILQKLSKSYHGQVVFSDLSLALSPGNAYCLMAPSGTGKTTLFRILMGLETPDSGTIDGLKNLKISGMRIFRRHEAPIVFAARPARSLRPFNFR